MSYHKAVKSVGFLTLKASSHPLNSPKENVAWLPDEQVKRKIEQRNLLSVPSVLKKLLITMVAKKVMTVFCDGVCQEWLHRQCAGLSKAAFESVSNSGSHPFHCPHCIITQQSKEISALKASVAALADDIELSE